MILEQEMAATMIKRITGSAGRLRALPLGAMLWLAGCGDNPTGAEVGGVSASEAQALNDAAEMLDNRAIPSAGSNATPER